LRQKSLYSYFILQIITFYHNDGKSPNKKVTNRIRDLTAMIPLPEQRLINKSEYDMARPQVADGGKASEYEG
jgi:hypothetical protein